AKENKLAESQQRPRSIVFFIEDIFYQKNSSPEPPGCPSYLSHHTLVAKLSGPWSEMAAPTLVPFTEISELGYVSRLMNGTSRPGNGFSCNSGNPLLRKFANASGPFRKEETQYWVLICSKALPSRKGLAAKYVSMADVEIADSSS